MKKSFFVIPLCIALLLCGCAREPAETPNTLAPSFMVDGTLYYNTGESVSGAFDESAIEGYITSTVHITQWPAENGQGNVADFLDAPYVKYKDGYALLWGGVWQYFKPAASEVE